MRIFVTGATGILGRRAVPLMLANGHQVTAVGRSLDRLSRLAQAGALPTTVDLFDRGAVTQAMRGHDAVVNLATHIPGPGMRPFLPGAWRETDRLRKTASSVLADAAIQLGVGRFVQESFALVYPDSGSRWLDESSPVQRARYNQTTGDAEASAARVATSGGIGVALRFALLYGAPDDPFTRELLRYASWGMLPLFGDPDGYVSMVTHHDAASAILTALELSTGVYNVTDDEPLTRHELAVVLGAALGTRPPKIPPKWLSVLGGSLGETIARSLRISNGKLRGASNWSPRYPSGREGWAAAHAALTNGG